MHMKHKCHNLIRTDGRTETDAIPYNAPFSNGRIKRIISNIVQNEHFFQNINPKVDLFEYLGKI